MLVLVVAAVVRESIAQCSQCTSSDCLSLNWCCELCQAAVDRPCGRVVVVRATSHHHRGQPDPAVSRSSWSCLLSIVAGQQRSERPYVVRVTSSNAESMFGYPSPKHTLDWPKCRSRLHLNHPISEARTSHMCVTLGDVRPVNFFFSTKQL